MKKSRSIRLALMGTASVALAACGDSNEPPPGAQFYSTQQECEVLYDAAACRAAFADAEQKQVAEGPRFSRKEQCEAEYGAGNCETHQAAGGGSYFMPFLMGYMVSNMFNGGRYAQPVYRGPDNSAVVASGGRKYNVGNFDTAAGRTAFRPTAAVTPTPRGGFGTTARGFGGAGT